MYYNENEIIQPKSRMLKGLTYGNDYNKYGSQSDITEELNHVESNAIVLTESVCKLG